MPRYRSPADEFDDAVLDAVDELSAGGPDDLAGELEEVQFAVEDVPPVGSPGDAIDGLAGDAVVDRGVLLGRVVRDRSPATILLYRRPIEARAVGPEDRADLIFTVVAELVAELLGRDIDEIDPRG